MAQSITMPALGESVTEGTVTAWLKQIGDQVEADEPIVEVATDKVDSEVPSPIAGVLLQTLVQEDDTVAVGTEIALVGDASEAVGSPAAPAPAAAAPVSAPEPAAPAAEEPTVAPAGDLIELTMPALGESVTEGTVTAWLKQIGDQVEADEPIVEVATDKVDSEVPAPVSGYLAEIRAEEDETVEVGGIIAVISSQAPSASGAAPAAAGPAATPAPAPAAPTPAPAPAPAAPAGRPTFAAPPARPAPPAPPAPPAAGPVAPAVPAASTHMMDPRQRVEAQQDTAAKGRIVQDKAAPAVSAGYVTPLVRKLARESDIDLAAVKGSGVGGRIRKEDVLAAVEAKKAAAAAPVPAAAPPASRPEPSPLRGKTEKMSRLRQTIARRMVGSLQTAAQLTTVMEVDVTKVAALRAKYKDQFLAQHGAKLTFLPFFVKAATDALQSHPKLNATIDGNQVTYFDHENIGIAVDAPKGLMVPVIKNAGELSLAGVAEQIGTLAAQVREGTISPDALTGSTFTITNTGSGGALFDTPVLNMPEVGIMGVGTIVRRPMVVRDVEGGESIAIRSMVYLSITYDHRLVDGADASRFLTAVKQRLEAADFTGDLGL